MHKLEYAQKNAELDIQGYAGGPSLKGSYHGGKEPTTAGTTTTTT